MYKLIILIPQQAKDSTFDDSWPRFLFHAERMPGLLREATIRVHHVLTGDSDIDIIHELYFESLRDLQIAMASEPGQAAGMILQQITGGRVSLLIAEHKEDTIDNLRQYRQGKENDISADA